MARRGATQSKKENHARLKALGKVAASFKDWRPQTEVLVNVQAVPTIFPQYDEITRIGGNPVGRYQLIHGPSNEGKTEFCLGLGLSYLKRGHFFAMVDAERTTTQRWVKSLMGEAVKHPAFVAIPPKSYEQVRAGVRQLCDTIGEARAKGSIPEDMTGLIVVDSIRKLIPKGLWDNLLKEAEGKVPKGRGGKPGKAKGIDGYGGRAGMMKAKLNAAWADELIPLMADTNMTIAVITREREDPNADGFSSKDWMTGGGGALFYEAALDIRVLKKSIYSGPKDKKVMTGELHTLEIHKTKIGRKQTAVPRCNFHTSNGIIVPAGFDRARDVLMMASDMDVVDLNGAWYSYDGARLGQGADKAVQALHASPELLEAVEQTCRSQFRDEVPDGSEADSD